MEASSLDDAPQATDCVLGAVAAAGGDGFPEKIDGAKIRTLRLRSPSSTFPKRLSEYSVPKKSVAGKYKKLP